MTPPISTYLLDQNILAQPRYLHLQIYSIITRSDAMFANAFDSSCYVILGVTILGNSHGFHKSGSVSGYVLWINGHGVMIDPPPYSPATLEREGIRPRTFVGIIFYALQP